MHTVGCSLSVSDRSGTPFLHSCNIPYPPPKDDWWSLVPMIEQPIRANEQ